MKISTKGRYALRMVIDIAEHAERGRWRCANRLSARAFR